MRNILLGGLIAVAATLAASAALPYWQSRDQVSVSGGGGGFSGPGDAVSGAAAFWSCSRAYTAAYASGNGNACDVQRTSDSATCTTKFASNGYLDQTTAYCTSNTQTIVQFCNATTCGVSKMYEQSGTLSCDSGLNVCLIVQTTAANQPTLNLNCLNSKPCIQLVQASSLFMTTTTNSITVRPFTITAVAKSTGSPTIRGVIFGDDSSTVLMALDRAGSDNAEINCGTQVTATASDASWHTLLGSCSALTSDINVDGTSSSSSTQASDPTGNTLHVGEIGAGQYGQANVTEIGLWPISFKDNTKNTVMCQNMQASYGSGNFGAVC